MNIIYDEIHKGYIISINENNTYSDEQMAKFLDIEEIDYMNILALNGCIMVEEVENNINKVYSVFENIKDAEKSLEEIIYI